MCGSDLKEKGYVVSQSSCQKEKEQREHGNVISSLCTYEDKFITRETVQFRSEGTVKASDNGFDFQKEFLGQNLCLTTELMKLDDLDHFVWSDKPKCRAAV